MATLTMATLTMATLTMAQARGGFTGHHSFMVKYTAGEDLGLDMRAPTKCRGRFYPLS